MTKHLFCWFNKYEVCWFVSPQATRNTDNESTDVSQFYIFNSAGCSFNSIHCFIVSSVDCSTYSGVCNLWAVIRRVAQKALGDVSEKGSFESWWSDANIFASFIFTILSQRLLNWIWRWWRSAIKTYLLLLAVLSTGVRTPVPLGILLTW